MIDEQKGFQKRLDYEQLTWKRMDRYKSRN